jgi:pre-mRNA-splicing factor ISY1
MARNSEKAHSMLFRFRAAQAAEAGIIDISRTRRPKLITSVTSIPVCEKWRGQVLKEISRKVTKIQDEALSDYQIRDLNDEINKAMREKYMWEKQIRDLGGPNYMRGGRVLDEEGREVPGGGKGYRYFGRAKELPGVKELFERQERPEDDDGARKGGEKRSELRQKVDAGYYGYNLDEEDGTLLAYEAESRRSGSSCQAMQATAFDGKCRRWRKSTTSLSNAGGGSYSRSWAKPLQAEQRVLRE